jgi:phosphoribosyl 1,2-cyclic phosphodiesterase
VELRSGDHTLICDAGSGIIPLGQALAGQDGVRELAVFLSHYHWDHISGLPFFLPAFTESWTVHLYGPGNGPEEVEQALAQQMKAPYFPVETETWLADVRYLRAAGGDLEYGPVRVHTFHTHHPGTTFGYRFEVAGKTVVYASDNELGFIDQLTAERLAEQDLEPGEHALLERIREEARHSSLDGFRNADILIHDAQYTPADYARKRGWGHSCYVDTVHCAIDAGVRHLYLFHLDPSYNDDQVDALHRHALAIIEERGSPMRCDIAREGLVLELVEP